MPITSADLNRWLTTTMLNIQPTMVDQWSKGHPLYDQFKRKNAIDLEDGIADQNGNPGVIVPLTTGAGSNGKFMNGPYDVVNLVPTDKEKGARYYLKHYTNGIVLAFLHEKANAGKKQLISMLKLEKQRLDTEIPEQIDKSLTWDTIAGGPTGLIHLAWPYNSGGGSVTGLGEGGVDQSTAAWNTVGGIDSSTSANSDWRNKVAQAVALSVSSLSDQMTDLEVEITSEGQGAPDLWAADKIAWKVAIKEAKENALINYTGRLSKVDLGYPVIYFNGSEIIYAIHMINPDDAAKGIIFGINTKWTRMKVWRAFNMYFTDFIGPWKGSGQQFTREQAFIHSFCMGTSNRRTLGVLANIPTS